MFSPCWLAMKLFVLFERRDTEVTCKRLSLKVGRGRGMRGRGDVGTRGRGDAGTWGREDFGTRRRAGIRGRDKQIAPDIFYRECSVGGIVPTQGVLNVVGSHGGLSW